MTPEELKATIDDIVNSAVNKAVSPLLESQKKYSGLFDNDPEKQKAEFDTAQKTEKLEPGIRMVRLAKLQLLSKSDPERALKIANEMYPRDKFTKDVLTEMSQKALGVSVGTEGGFLVPEVLAQEVIPLLYAKTAIFESGARKIDMPSGNLTIPKLVGGATAYYQGENLPAGKSQPKFGNVSLKSRKLITLVPTSNDLLRSSSASADAIIRDDMMQQMRLKLDWAGLYGDGTDFVPLGVKKVPNIQTYGGGAVMTADDPATMIGQLKGKNTPMLSPGWIFNSIMEAYIRNLKTTTGAYIYRSEMDTKGTILSLPYHTTEQIPLGTDNHVTTDIFLGDWAELIFGSEVDFEMASSQEAAYDIGGGQMISAFSNDQTILRVLSKHDYGVRHATSFLVGSFYTK